VVLPVAWSVATIADALADGSKELLEGFGLDPDHDCDA
jgi:hypothetical protein